MPDIPVRIEVIPGAGLEDRLRAHLPAPAVVTVTCLPHHGPDETIATAVRLAGAGYTAIPHLAARSVPGRSELAEYASQCMDAGIRDVFVIGGDRTEAAGPYAWSGPLMEDLAELSGGTLGQGVAVYPEGHPASTDQELLGTLLSKQVLASWGVTQLCFSPDTLRAFVPRLRQDGVTLPIWAGVPGPVRISRLLRLAGTIGVGQSVGFLRRSAGGADAGSVVRQLLSSASYDPAPLVAALDGAGYEGIHLYSFNDLEGLERSGMGPPRA
ncbi:methylenetetrahydrofolate reductase [Arthrobacter sp. TMS2-4]